MTPQEIAARLPELTGGPHDDDTITALAQITAEAVRALNHATFPRATLSEPGTVYRVLGELATAANRLPQLATQLARWLDEENTAGRLAHDPAPARRHGLRHGPARPEAPRYAALLGGALDDAQQATAGLYRPGRRAVRTNDPPGPAHRLAVRPARRARPRPVRLPRLRHHRTGRAGGDRHARGPPREDHPELPGQQEEWLAALAAALWPGDEYAAIITGTWRKDRP